MVPLTVRHQHTQVDVEGEPEDVRCWALALARDPALARALAELRVDPPSTANPLIVHVPKSLHAHREDICSALDTGFVSGGALTSRSMQCLRCVLGVHVAVPEPPQAGLTLVEHLLMFTSSAILDELSSTGTAAGTQVALAPGTQQRMRDLLQWAQEYEDNTLTPGSWPPHDAQVQVQKVDLPLHRCLTQHCSDFLWAGLSEVWASTEGPLPTLAWSDGTLPPSTMAAALVMLYAPQASLPLYHQVDALQVAVLLQQLQMPQAVQVILTAVGHSMDTDTALSLAHADAEGAASLPEQVYESAMTQLLSNLEELQGSGQWQAMPEPLRKRVTALSTAQRANPLGGAMIVRPSELLGIAAESLEHMADAQAVTQENIERTRRTMSTELHTGANPATAAQRQRWHLYLGQQEAALARRAKAIQELSAFYKEQKAVFAAIDTS